jgi:hypothetical protein
MIQIILSKKSKEELFSKESHYRICLGKWNNLLLIFQVKKTEYKTIYFSFQLGSIQFHFLKYIILIIEGKINTFKGLLLFPRVKTSNVHRVLIHSALD